MKKLVFIKIHKIKLIAIFTLKIAVLLLKNDHSLTNGSIASLIIPGSPHIDSAINT